MHTLNATKLTALKRKTTRLSSATLLQQKSTSFLVILLVVLHQQEISASPTAYATGQKAKYAHILQQSSETLTKSLLDTLPGRLHRPNMARRSLPVYIHLHRLRVS